MQEKKRIVRGGVTMEALTKNFDDGSTKFAWYGSQFDPKGGLHHGVHSLDIVDADGRRVVGQLSVQMHGYTSEYDATMDAKACAAASLI